MLPAYQRARHRAICASSADRAHGPCLDERSAAKLMETPATRPRCDAPQHEAERQAKPARRCPPYLGLLRRHPRGLQREQEASPYVFVSERAGMPFQVFPHMLRHACGYALANAGHDTRALQAWLGHKNIQHTVRYTELAPYRFKNFWRD